MADDPNNRGPQDRARINLGQDHEIAWWTSKFGVSEERLRQAISAVGSTRADVVASYLGKIL